jgi:hypothetical protein
MSEAEKTTLMKLAEAMEALPESKREYLMGYAEGVAAMREAGRKATEEKTEEQSA